MESDLSSEIIALLPRLRRFARGLCGSASEADDLVQGACERALRSIASWQPGTRLDSWLFSIIRNLWIDQYRRERLHSDGLELAAIAGEDGQRVAEKRLELQDVSAAIARLSAEQREVVLLVCVEEQSYREAARILNIPIGTVMSRLARARLALAAQLGLTDARPAKTRGASQ